MNPPTLKFFGIVFSLILILNIVLFALRKISWMVFWGVIIVGVVVVYVVLPKLKSE